MRADKAVESVEHACMIRVYSAHRASRSDTAPSPARARDTRARARGLWRGRLSPSLLCYFRKSKEGKYVHEGARRAGTAVDVPYRESLGPRQVNLVHDLVVTFF